MRKFLGIGLLVALAVGASIAFFGGTPENPDDAPLRAQGVPAGITPHKERLGKKKATGSAHCFTFKTNADGYIEYQLVNGMDVAATDLHFSVDQKANKDVKISEVILTGPLSDVHPNLAGPPAAPAAEVEARRTGTNSVPSDGGGADPAQNSAATQIAKLKFVKNGEVVAEKDVKVCIWWTSIGAAGTFGAPVVSLGNDKVGNGVLASAVVLGYEPDGAEVTERSATMVLPPIVIAEAAHGYRFESGEILLSLSRGVQFDLTQTNLVIEAIDQNGDTPDPAQISFGPARVDREGNLVFSVTRDPGDELGVAIVIREAVTGGPLTLSWLNAGDTVSVNLQGPAVTGMCIHDFQVVATVVEESGE